MWGHRAAPPRDRIGADEHALARPGSPAGQLGQRGTSDGDVIDGGVRSRVPRTQLDREHLPGPAGPWSANAHNGRNPNPFSTWGARVPSRCARLAASRPDRSRSLRPAPRRRLGMLTSALPRGDAGFLPGRIDRWKHPIGILREDRDSTGRGRIRRDRPIHVGLGAQRRDIEKRVPTERESDREIQDHLARSCTASGFRHGASADDSTRYRPPPRGRFRSAAPRLHDRSRAHPQCQPEPAGRSL